MRRDIASVKRAGFTYVALDLEGYRQGSLNESLSQPNALEGPGRSEHNSAYFRIFL